jgi:hypothetical protein
MAPQLFSHNKQFTLEFLSSIIFSSKTDPKRLARRHDEINKKSEIIKPNKGVTSPPDLVGQQAQAQQAQTATKSKPQTATQNPNSNPSPSPARPSNQQQDQI